MRWRRRWRGFPISLSRSRIPTAERSPATAHLFIINPLTHGGFDNLFATHPSTENRIAALQRVAAEMGQGGFGRRRGRSRSCAAAGRTLGQRPRRGPWG